MLVSELNYHPSDEGATDGDDFEFIELKNVYTATLDLSGIYFGDAIEYTFPATATIGANQYLVLVRKQSQFATRYPTVTPAGVYQGDFSNDGERVTLANKQGQTIISFQYEDQPPWPQTPDGQGYTLIRHDESGLATHPCSWRASTNLYGSPGTEEPASNNANCASATTERLLVSELNYHPSDEGATDGDDFEFIELKNIYTATLDLSGIYFGDAIEYTFPATATIGVNEYLVLVRNQSQFATRYPTVTPAGVYEGDFSNNGEQIILANKEEETIISFEYDDQFPWPQEADGKGYTLVQRDPSADPNDGCNWRASSKANGSPGMEDPPSHGTGCSEIYLPILLSRR